MQNSLGYTPLQYHPSKAITTIVRMFRIYTVTIIQTQGQNAKQYTNICITRQNISETTN